MSVSSEETPAAFLARLGIDAAKWAEEFRKTAIKLGYSDMDKGWLIGWFANAITAAHDRQANKFEPALSAATARAEKAERERDEWCDKWQTAQAEANTLRFLFDARPSSGHSPGPWLYQDGEITSQDGTAITVVHTADDFPCGEGDDLEATKRECEANARLIAAAPQTLARAEKAEAKCQEMWHLLKWYAERLCELGADHEPCGKLDEADCIGCPARSFLKENDCALSLTATARVGTAVRERDEAIAAAIRALKEG